MTFHGCLQIELGEVDAESGADVLQREVDAIAAVRKRIDSAPDTISRYDVGRGGME